MPNRCNPLFSVFRKEGVGMIVPVSELMQMSEFTGMTEAVLQRKLNAAESLIRASQKYLFPLEQYANQYYIQNIKMKG